ncbi:two component transcriptional regulator, LuxR family [Micromonospora pattaloongensis]|uniref:Two component transcriptional regulator, LuxR family n=1 Tax=Micromonospora pattaloongensis TaxID=405436 RepID=A0A1H3NSH8_9ACTN|nr:response regulator transcription factor [Micromonospora pattaloongensis]SDY91867.1 two component transcriptional regulator, LuxR family [Micromonospora pattaloongensis]
MIRIMIVEEMGLLRGALRAVLSSEDDLEVIADLSDGADVPAVAARERPDVLLVDLELAGTDMLAVLRRLTGEVPGCAVLALSRQRSPEALQEALLAGVRGFIGKDVPPAELARLVRAVARGERVVDPVAAVAALRPTSGPLTGREREVLRAAAMGLPSKEIARTLFLAHGTVRNHLSVILRKTGTRNRMEAIRRAQQEGWL